MASSAAATAEEEAGIVDDVDYGYEEHTPSPRSVADNYLILISDKSLGAPPCRSGSLTSTEEENPQHCLEEVSASSFCPTSHQVLLSTSMDRRNQHHSITFSHQQQKPQQEAPPPSVQQSKAHVPQMHIYDESSYCSQPASCHNHKRRHNRRGGYVHGSLLRSAVLASMESSPDDEDQPRPYRQNSAISLQSLQDALRETSSLASSPRKRARKVSRRRRSSCSSDHDGPHEQHAQREDNNNPELESMLNALRVQDPQAAALVAHPEPPMRRVSRKTSCDSRISDFSDWDEEEFWGGSACSSQDQPADESDSD